MKLPVLKRLMDLEPDTYFKTTLTKRWGKIGRAVSAVFEDGVNPPTMPVLVHLSEMGSALRNSSPLSIKTWELRGINANCIVEVMDI